MPTTLHKPVSRRTMGRYQTLYAGGHNARPIVVTLLPGDVLEFREHGRRGKWLVSVHSAFRFAVRCKAFHDMNQKRKDKATKRKSK